MDPNTGALLFWLIVGYFVVSPDRGSLALSRGLAGGVRGALSTSSSSSRSTGSSKKGKTKKTKKGGKTPDSDATAAGPSRWDSATAGWRQGVAAARQAREEGRDTWSRTSKAAGQIYGGTRTFADRARTAYRTKRATKKWTRPGTETDSTAAADAAGPTDSPAAAVPPSPAVAGDTHPADEATDSSESPAAPVYDITEISGAAAAAGGTTEKEHDMNETELASVQQAQAEFEAYEVLIRTQLQELAQTLRWSKRLGDRWSGTKWSTAPLDQAIAAISEAPTVNESMQNGVRAAIKACQEARTVGEIAAATGAKGDLQAFKAAS